MFLLSVRSGAVGINLTAASHVFLLEPCLNPALEEQAVGRAWRMGQQRTVAVKRFYVKVGHECLFVKPSLIAFVLLTLLVGVLFYAEVLPTVLLA